MPTFSFMARAEKRKLWDIVLNIVVILFSLWGILSAVFNILDCDKDHWNWGWKVFKYYTNDSNMLGSLACLLIAVYHIRYFKEDKPLPIGLIYFKLIGASSMLFTFFTVVATMGNVFTFWALFGFPSTLFLHTLSPLLCTFTFLFFDDSHLKKRFATISFVPILVYSFAWVIALLILNLPKEVELDNNVYPYFFLAIHNQPWYISALWIVGLSCLHYGVCLGLLCLKNLIIKRREKQLSEKGSENSRKNS